MQQAKTSAEIRDKITKLKKENSILKSKITEMHLKNEDLLNFLTEFERPLIFWFLRRLVRLKQIIIKR